MLRKLALFLLCLVMLGTMTQTRAEASLIDASLQLLEALKAGDEETVLKDMTDEMIAAMKGNVAGVWPQLVGLAGAFKEVADARETERGGYRVTEIGLQFENLYLVQTVSFDAAGKVAGFTITPGAPPEQKARETLPGGLSETDITVTADERYPLAGKLTLPEGEVLAGLVLVHGSGPNDLDERVGPNKPFMNLAYGLAQRGFAVLRYNKRTLSYGAQMMEDAEYARLTVDEETALDAAAAIKLLMDAPQMAGKKVFVLGHSMGAMLSSYIGSINPDAAGYVLMAGTPRKLWEIIEEQNLLALSELPESESAPFLPMLAAELDKAKRLTEMTDEEALDPENAPFTISAWYLRHWEAIDPAMLHLQDGKPVLVLHGGRDRQVTKKDFDLWQEGLNGHPDAQFILYPNLNHLFGHVEGEPVPPSELVTVEYMQETPVPPQVIDDIAGWAKDRL